MTALRRSRPAALGALVALGAALASCGGGASASAPPARVAVRSTSIPGLGRVLADGNGFTLYAYMPDRRGASRCFGMCAHQWPPLLLPSGQRSARAGTGVEAAKLGTARRPDGVRQVTYDGWPLYTFRNDVRPGQATGQADDMGAWYTVAVNGAIDYGTVRGGNG